MNQEPEQSIDLRDPIPNNAGTMKTNSLLSTETGRSFLQCYNRLCACLDEIEKQQPSSTEQENSQAVIEILDFFDELHERLDAEIHKPTVLFEINSILEGNYRGNQGKLYKTDNPKGLRKIMDDVLALLQNFIIKPKANLQQNEPYGITHYYENWRQRILGESGKENDYLQQDCESLITIKEIGVDHEAKRRILNTIGWILEKLEVDEQEAKSVLKKDANQDIIKSRGMINGDILMNLQVLQRLKRSPAEFAIDVTSLLRAIRFWASSDSFLKELFECWNWNYYDKWGEYLRLRTDGSDGRSRPDTKLRESWNTPSSNLDVGQSFIKERMEGDQSKKMIPIMVVGHSKVGKSTLFTALHYWTSQNSDEVRGNFTSGPTLTAHYNGNELDWRANKDLQCKKRYVPLEFWRDKLVHFVTYDYRGEEAESPDEIIVRDDDTVILEATKPIRNPDSIEAVKDSDQAIAESTVRWSRDFKRLSQKARGFLFMIDDADISNPDKLRIRAAWFKNILAHWVKKNPESFHIPIAIVINKCDKILKQNLGTLERSSILHGVSPPGIEYPSQDEDGKLFGDEPFIRLRNAIIYDPKNNQNPELQDFIEIILESLCNFFKDILKITYNYEIFLVSSKAPSSDEEIHSFPWGVYAPFEWLSSKLEKQFLRESYDKCLKDRAVSDKKLIELRHVSKRLHKLDQQINSCIIKQIELNDRQERILWNPIRKKIIRSKIKGQQEVQSNFEGIFKQLVDTKIKQFFEEKTDQKEEKRERQRNEILDFTREYLTQQESYYVELLNRLEDYETRLKINTAIRPDPEPPTPEKPTPNTRLAILLSLLVPGIGHFVIKSRMWGAIWLVLFISVWTFSLTLMTFPLNIVFGLIPHITSAISVYFDSKAIS